MPANCADIPEMHDFTASVGFLEGKSMIQDGAIKAIRPFFEKWSKFYSFHHASFLSDILLPL
ncbi:hypothetical protein DXA14_00010 [Hungatella hathewayi]|jgi:hypothetical protein|uniref:Uncharacterized protein n=1 Tax=Hungatella hathewayi DSM 13479 TaxID=566550 RepID=D3ARN0_9FIRM|nr:hypothetical protein CLOSTHATH_06287 [Hungatella hathewayi DSM 13479]RGZ07727.1 hypothetical protein DXA14_00010 [Hungatella hathewayi]RHB64735.1 hypothetical protein DW876_25540 [Hungatella hathewayi]